MTEIEKMMQEDAMSEALPSNDELSELGELADAQLTLERQIDEAEKYVKKVKEQLQNIQCVAIPNLLDSMGVKEVKLANGMKLTVKEDVKASIRSGHIEQAVAWLEEHNIGDIVKNEFKVKFGRGEDTAALSQFCEQHGYNAEQKQSVHPMTMKATVKEQMANGVEFPEELFSIFPDRKSVIKLK